MNCEILRNYKPVYNFRILLNNLVLKTEININLYTDNNRSTLNEYITWLISLTTS